MTRQILVAFVLIGALGMFGAWALCATVKAENNADAQNADDVEILRKRLAAVSRIKDKDRFLAEYWKLQAEQHIAILLKKGDRYMLGGGMLVLKPDATFDLISKSDLRQNVNNIAHVVTQQGDWKPLDKGDISSAKYLVISTDDLLFVINLVRQTVSIVTR